MPDRTHHDSDAAQSIREHALALFARGGYTGTSLRQISTAVGCDVALVPYYFGSKAKLFTGVVGDASSATRREVLEGFERTMADAQDPATAMESVYRFMDAWTEGEGQLSMRALIMTAAAGEAVPSAIQEFARSELQSLVDQITEFEGFWEETRWGLTTFVAMVMGTEILKHMVEYEPITSMDRQELARLKVAELRSMLEMLWERAEESGGAPTPAST
ncbi:MAG: TetR/AcrR family transcriptional regulator [bacterium]|nr:TetR/AcrR family transcriptional regulator [bacterium]